MIDNPRCSGPGTCVVAAALFLVMGTPAFASPPVSNPPRLHIGTMDYVFLGSGLALAGAGLALDTRTTGIPVSGLDRGDIGIGWDRRSVLLPRSGPDAASGGALVGTAVTPYLLNMLAESPDRLQSQLRLGRVQGESLALTAGAVLLLKPVFSRPRPFAYVEEEDRPKGIGEKDTFESFPSGHAALAWSAGTAGMLFLAGEHPEMPHFLTGALLGGLATSVSLLRVEAGEHFPTDAGAGFVLGTGVGAGVALFHLNKEDRSPPWPAVRDGLLGMATGAVLAFLLTPPTSPWVE